MSPLNRDLVNNMPANTAATAAMAVIDAVQDHPPGPQLGGICCAFLMACEHLGIPAQDVLSATKNMLNDREGLTAEFQAVRMYVENEL